MEKDKKNKDSTHCDTDSQKKMTEKLTDCDTKNATDKDRSKCYEDAVKEEKDSDAGACINS